MIARNRSLGHYFAIGGVLYAGLFVWLVCDVPEHDFVLFLLTDAKAVFC